MNIFDCEVLEPEELDFVEEVCSEELEGLPPRAWFWFDDLLQTEHENSPMTLGDGERHEEDVLGARVDHLKSKRLVDINAGECHRNSSKSTFDTPLMSV
jgi:hypothetical protein